MKNSTKTNKLIHFTLSILLIISSLTVFAQKNVHGFTMADIDGKKVDLNQYKGKVLLIVYVASKCGLTPQYESLEAFYKKYKSKGLVILGFPANNFMGQEPGENADIKQFCSRTYNVTFPMFSKISVKGKDIAPLYKYLTEKKENGVLDSGVKWNFQKFLIGKDGKVVTSFSPPTTVDNEDLIKAVEAELKK
jgi:glutathione peroxidase